MKNKKTILYCLIIIVITNWLTAYICSLRKDNDYQKVGLEIRPISIEYCTNYDYYGFSKYKVYKIKKYYADSMDEYRIQLENSELWSRDKFYEYIMVKFDEIIENETISIDRENLYYYFDGGRYAIFDLKNAKLYYYERGIMEGTEYRGEIFGIDIDDYIEREIYSITGGPQNDGTDYYTYKFTEEKGKQIQEELSKSEEWSTEKLNEDIIDCFEHNPEVNTVQNGYYHYKLVCRTSDDYKKEHFTPEEATGYEVGVYDIDTNTLYYYYWTY